MFKLIIALFLLNSINVQGQNFTCSNGDLIPLMNFCDGSRNCADGSDEIYTRSNVSNNVTSVSCSRSQRFCLISLDYFCDEVFDCRNIDRCEAGCPNYYRCENNECVMRSTVCDGQPCNGCPEDDGWETGVGFQCVRSGERCKLPQQLLWDGIQDCDQGEDLCYTLLSPENVNLGRDIRGVPFVSFDQSRCFQCLDKAMIIPREKVCDNVIDCSDLSDECLCEGVVPSICNDITTRGSVLISPEYPHKCDVGQISCSNQTCINRSAVCDSISDCTNNKDERYAYCRGTLECRNGRIQDQGKRCRCGSTCDHAIGTLCDGIGQCPPPAPLAKWAEEPGYPADECRAQCTNTPRFNCTVPIFSGVGPALSVIECESRVNSLSPSEADSSSNPSGADSSSNPSGDVSSSKSLASNSSLNSSVAGSSSNPSRPNSSSNSSDVSSSSNPTRPGSFSNSTGTGSTSNSSDAGSSSNPSRPNSSSNSSDVSSSSNPTRPGSFSNSTGTGSTSNSSDAGSSSNPSRPDSSSNSTGTGSTSNIPGTGSSTNSTENSSSLSREATDSSSNLSGAGFSSNSTGIGSSSNPSGASSSLNLQSSQLIIVDSTQFCDGISDCNVNLEDELNCTDRYYCQSNSKINIPLDLVCDGTIDCDDGSDESNVTCPDRYFCSSLDGAKVSIDESLICDFIINCDNEEDEMNCTDGRFYCESGNPLFVRERQVYDGNNDCEDSSDECPTVSEARNENAFSSRFELIANPILRVLVWIMGILALVGNTVVIVLESKLLYKMKEKRGSVPLRTNHTLILNLAIADLLMGVYLVMLGVAGVVYSGVFCAHELSWRSGVPCQIMGVLVVISSETSVITMMLLAGFRLFAVFKPFLAANKPSGRTLLLLISMAWFISLLLALLPFTVSLQRSFFNIAIIPNNPFFRSVLVSFESAQTWIENLLTFEPSLMNVTANFVYNVRDATTWGSLQAILGNTSHSELLQPTGYIGYYGIQSVCIPRLFATQSDNAWEFSIVIAIFNFLAFIFVATAYAIIITKARKTPIKTHNSVAHYNKREKRTEAMQKKIYRLVATDFCCWAPISIMVFINFSGVPLSDIAYVVSAIVLLPINSALNPILYSDLFDKLLKKIRRSRLKYKTTNNNGKSSDTPKATIDTHI